MRNIWNSYFEYRSNCDRNKNLSLKEYLYQVKPYLKDIVTDLQESDTWKIQLTIAINFISSKHAEEERAMHSTSNNEDFFTDDNANDIIDELLKSLLSRYQNNLETSIRGHYFIFDSVQLLYYKFHKINFVRGGSYIDTTD